MYNPRLEKELSAIRELMCKLGCLNETDMPKTRLITESQASKSISAAKALAMKELKCDEEGANDFIQRLRNDMPVLNGKGAAKFMLGVARMFFAKQLKDTPTINQLNDTLEYVASPAHINEYDRNLNKLSAQELIQRFANALDMEFEKDKAEISQYQYETNGQYDIVRIDSFEQAQQYRGYTEWCVTQYEKNFNGYTNDGINQFYFCLRKGFENVEKEIGEGCPLDEYGLSMVAVCVNERGALKTCTCRWNHENDGNDKIMNTKQISELIGQNFYDVFKPNHNWQDAVESALARLKSGESPEDVFDRCENANNGYTIVKLKKKWNYIDADNNFLSPNQWFDYCDEFVEGYAKVGRNNKYNFIGVDGNILSPDLWFDWCNEFYNGYSQVQVKDKDNHYKFNFIGTDGKFLSPNEWFDGFDYVYEGYARVMQKNEDNKEKHNFIDTNGKLLSPDLWFDDCNCFENGYAKVMLKDEDNKDKYNFIGRDGNLISPDLWFDECSDSRDYNIWVKVKDEYGKDKFNWIDLNGKFLSPSLWFDACYRFNDCYAQVKLNGKWNFIYFKGNLLSPDLWFEKCEKFQGGYANVRLNGQWRVIDIVGNLYDTKTHQRVGNVRELGRQVTNESIDRIIKESISQVLRRRRRLYS